MRELGVAVVRVSPHANRFNEALQLVRGALDGTLPAAQAAAQLEPLLPGPACNGYWHGGPGMEQRPGLG